LRRLGGGVPNGHQTLKLSGNPRFAVDSAVRTLDGRTLLIGSQDREVIILDALTLSPVLRLPVPEFARLQVALAANGSLLALGTTELSAQARTRVALYRFPSGELLGEVPTDSEASLALSPDGSRLALSHSNGFNPGTAELWNTVTLKQRNNLAAQALFAVFAPDGNHALTAAPDGLSFFDPASGAPLEPRIATKNTFAAAFDPTGQKLLILGKEHAVFDVATGTRTASFSDPSATRAFAFAPDGRTVAIDSREGEISLRRVVDGAKLASVSPLFGRDAAVVLSESGFDVLGDERAVGLALVGRVGPFSVPWQACEDRLRIRGLLNRALKNCDAGPDRGLPGPR
jgi:WD40 repeat protein